MKRSFLATLLMMSALLLMLQQRLNAQGIPYIRNFPATEYKAHNQNFDIISGQDGTIYVANFEGLLYYDNSLWRIIHTPGITRLTSVFCDSKGTIWTGGYNYVGYVESDKAGNLQLHDIKNVKIFQGEVQWIWKKAGHIYFKVSDDKIYTVKDGNVISAFSEKVPTTGSSVYETKAHINQTQQLENGLNAVATNGDGLIITDENNQELFRITDVNGLCSNNINHITYNKHGLIWGATDNGLFCIEFPSIYSHFTTNEGLHGEVLSIEQLDGHIYAGTLGGLYKLKGHRFEQVGNISHACWQLVRQGNTLLAATADGTYRISPDGKISQLTTANTLSLLVVKNGFYSGEMDDVYFNTTAGRKKVSEVERVVKIMTDSLGTIWMQNLYGKIWKGFVPYNPTKDENNVATIYKYRKEVKMMSTDDTKPFPYPAFSYCDPQGVLWLTDNKGKHLYAYSDGSRNAKMSSLAYPLMDYSIRTMLRTGNKIWMGGDRGICVIDQTQQDPTKLIKPHVQIRSVEILDSVVWGGFGKMPEMLPELDNSFHRITINYSINYPSLLMRTQYRYRLNGGNWTAWDNDRFEEFPNLPSGSYTFEVQARDAHGQISDSASISFIIKQPWYWRWYMILLYLVLAAAVSYLFIIWRTQRLEKEKHRLESLVKERTDEVVKLEKVAAVGKLTQGLIDRILNPLNYINNFAKLSEGLVNDVRANIEDEQENMDPENYEDTIDVLDMLKGNLQKVGEHGASTSRTLKAMEEMLKDRTGGIIKMNLTPLLHQNEEMVKKYFEKQIAEYHISTVFDLPNHDVFINGNAEQLSKTFMNILGNALYAVIKQTKRHEGGEPYTPEIKFRAAMSDKHIQLHIRDNGIGIEHTIIDKIFDPFFTTKTTGEATGVGLYLCREIIQNHGGDITAKSEKHVYTEFTITLPTL